MTELYNLNKKTYFELLNTIWDFDEESLKYIDYRTSDEWKPSKEFYDIIRYADSYEDQRARYNINLANPEIQSIFEKEDEAYALFLSCFRYALKHLSEKGCYISYEDFINNKTKFNKNIVKLKKVIETAYKENNEAFNNDFNSEDYSEENIVKSIMEKFERIGASKKSSKKMELVVSWNPFDWLLSSSGQQKLTSCFNLSNPKGGFSYAYGIPFLCADKCRVMVYITDGSKKEFMGIKTDFFMTRTWGILGDNNKISLVKWYPNDTIGINPINTITKTSMFCSVSDFTKEKYPFDKILSTKKGMFIGVYNDMGRLESENGKLYLKGTGRTGQQNFTNRGTYINDKDSSFKLDCDTLTHGFDISIKDYDIIAWKKYGFHIDSMITTCKCSVCGKDRAGFMVGKDRNNKEFFCKDCYVDAIQNCDCCGNAKRKDSKFFDYKDDNDKVIHICEDCNNDSSKYICSCCGKWQSNYGNIYEFEKKKYCRSCIENGKAGITFCKDGCQNLTKNINLIYNSFTETTKTLCDNCLKDLDNSGVYETFGREFKVFTKKKLVRGLIE